MVARAVLDGRKYLLANVLAYVQLEGLDVADLRDWLADLLVTPESRKTPPYESWSVDELVASLQAEGPHTPGFMKTGPWMPCHN